MSKDSKMIDRDGTPTDIGPSIDEFEEDHSVFHTVALWFWSALITALLFVAAILLGTT